MKGLADITARYIEKPFSRYGCIELVYYFLNDLGTPLPEEIDGWNVNNYHDLVKEDIQKAQNIMISTFMKIGKVGNILYPSIGNLLIIEQKDGEVKFPAVYVGKKQAIASFIRNGVQVFKINELNKVILCRSIDQCQE